MKKLCSILAIVMLCSCLLVGCGGGSTTSDNSDVTDEITTTTADSTTTGTDADVTTTVSGDAGDGGDTTTTTKKQQQTTKAQGGTNPTGAQGLPGGDGKMENKVEELSTYQFPKRTGVTGTVRVFIPWDVNDRYERLKTEFEAAYPGTKVEYITSPWNTRNTKLANQVKAKKYIDCVSTVYNDFPERIFKKLVRPLDEYLVNGETLNATLMSKLTAYNGENYALMRSAYPYVIYYNADMFEEYGEKTPLEYYNEGAWNWSNFRTVAANMTDVQNGKVKTYGFGTDDDTIFMLSAGTDAITFKDGKPKLNTDDPKFASSLDFFYKMCNTDKSVYAERWLNFNAFLEKKTAMSYWRADGDSLNRLKEAKINWEIVPFPKAEGATEYYGGALGDGWALGVNCANPLGGIAFAEWEINDRAKLNTKELTFSADQKKRLASIVSTMSLISCYGMETSFSNGFCNAMRNNGSMSAKLEEYIPEWEMLIDDVVNGK